VLLAIRFKVEGSLRFLSHAETVKVLQRACVRAGIRIQYSEGFNPRPRLSLPLPRPVGVESDDELLCLRVARDPLPPADAADERPEASDESRIKDALACQLPEGCELLSVSAAEAGTAFAPRAATYVLTVRRECLTEELEATIERLLASEHLPIRRPTDEAKTQFKNVDVRRFLKSITLDQASIMVECEISPAGSIRVEEILDLLGLDEGKLVAPIKRTNVRWQGN
jgi:radical SAM-linked protein